MKKIIREFGWFFNKYTQLSLVLMMIVFVVVELEIIFRFVDEVEVSLKNLAAHPLSVAISFLCALIFVFLFIGGIFFTDNKNPKIARDEARKILKEKPQLNPPIDNHVELVKWLKSYEALSSKEKKLTTITERLNKLPKEKKELEANKENLETEVKNLKSELGMS